MSEKEAQLSRLRPFFSRMPKGPVKAVQKASLYGAKAILAHPELVHPTHPHNPLEMAPQVRQPNFVDTFGPPPSSPRVDAAERDEYVALSQSQLWNPTSPPPPPDPYMPPPDPFQIKLGFAPYYVEYPREKKAQGQEGLPTAYLRFLSGDEEKCGFTIEIAKTPEHLAAGLMYREEMPLEHGMLFAFPETKRQSFWMKNTPLPLDMIFMDEQGVVVGIVEDAEPYDEGRYGVDSPSRYVLEINAGRARDCGIEEGWKAVVEESIQPDK